MVARWVVVVCLVLGCAVAARGEEPGGESGVTLAKLEEPKPAKLSPAAQALELPDGVKVRESFQYYDIDGLTADELRSQMKHNGTTWNDGNVYAALTTWDLRYHYDIVAKDGRFQLTEVATMVDIVFHMPRLSNGARAPQPLKALWGGYLEHLQTHESGHRDIAVASCRELYQALAGLGSSASRRDLEQQAESVIKNTFKRLKELQVDYDAETHHGIRQGAVLGEPTLAGGPAS